MDTLSILAALALAAAPAAAGQADSPEIRNDIMKKAVEMYQAGGDEGPDPKMEAEHYARSLGLQPKQQAAALKILQEKQKALRKNVKAQRAIQDEVDSLHRRIQELNAGLREDFKALGLRLAEVQGKLRGLLRPEQQQRYDAMEAERRKAEEEHRKREEETWRRQHPGEGPNGGQGSHREAPPEGARP